MFKPDNIRHPLAELDSSILKWMMTMLAINLLVWVYAALGYFMPQGQSINVWFQRSGSLTLVISILMEIQLLKLLTQAREWITYQKNHHNKVPLDSIKANIHFERLSKQLSVLVHLSTVASTLIWGYGDLLIN